MIPKNTTTSPPPATITKVQINDEISEKPITAMEGN